MMQTDVKAKGLSSSDEVFAGPTRVKAITISYSPSTTVNIRDGGLTGTIVWSFVGPDIDGTVHVLFPGEGIKCQTSVFAQFSGAHVTVVYG